MCLSNRTNLKSSGVSNCKNFNSKNCSKYALREVDGKNEKKSSLCTFRSKNLILIIGIIYVAIL
ncbi:glycophorin binding protein, partial [Plasmodium gaboni]